MRWLLAVTLTGCIYQPKALDSSGDSRGDPDRLPRLETWTDIGNSGVGPRDDPFDSSANGGGVSQSGADATLPAVVATDTAVVVAWQDVGENDQAIVRVRRYADRVWSSYDDEPDGFVAFGTRPSLTLASGGVPVVANGNEWTYAGDPLFGPGAPGVPSLAINADGVPTLAWFHGDGTAGHPTVRVDRFLGGSWVALGERLGTLPARRPSVAVAGDRAVVAFLEQGAAAGTWSVVVSEWDDDEWLRINGNLSKRDALEPSVALDGAGRPVVAWAEERSSTDANFEIRLTRFNGDTWTGVDGSDVGGGISNTSADSRYPSLDVQGDRTCVAWTDSGPAGLQVAVRCIDLPAIVR